MLQKICDINVIEKSVKNVCKDSLKITKFKHKIFYIFIEYFFDCIYFTKLFVYLNFKKVICFQKIHLFNVTLIFHSFLLEKLFTYHEKCSFFKKHNKNYLQQ